MWPDSAAVQPIHPEAAPLPASDAMAHIFPGMLARFDAWMTVKGWSDATRHTYRYELVCFVVDYLALQTPRPITEATEADLHAYVASLPAHGSKRGDAMRALKAFYGGWAHGRIREDDPTRDLRIPRPKLVPAPTLTPDSQRRLVAAAFRKEPRRGWSIVLALETGARVSSLVDVRREDVHTDWVWFRTAKGDRPYRLPLTRSARLACAHLLADGHDPLVGVGAARFRQWVHEAEQTAGLERVWPHLLRHEFSRRLAAAGDPEAWRIGMNHADMSQWPRYNAEHTDERLRRALAG